MKGGARISVKAAAVIVLGFNENELWPLKEPFPALIAPAIASRSSYVLRCKFRLMSETRLIRKLRSNIWNVLGRRGLNPVKCL
jgi:hypothetical protein